MKNDLSRSKCVDEAPNLESKTQATSPKPVSGSKELPIIQKTYDFVKWYIPILNKLPRDHKFNLGDRIINHLYEFLEVLLQARYSRDKLPLLEKLNTQLEVMRYQTRLLYDFTLISTDRYEYIAKQLNGIGNELGGWIKQQRKK